MFCIYVELSVLVVLSYGNLTLYLSVNFLGINNSLPTIYTVYSHQQTSSAPEDVDKLLDIDQALVQIRSMKHKWRELAESVRLPETMIKQVRNSIKRYVDYQLQV